MAMIKETSLKPHNTSVQSSEFETLMKYDQFETFIHSHRDSTVACAVESPDDCPENRGEDVDTGLSESVDEQRAPLLSEDTLPSGWKQYSDQQGVYYWHIKSGTVQRARPLSSVVIRAPHSAAAAVSTCLLVPGTSTQISARSSIVTATTRDQSNSPPLADFNSPPTRISPDMPNHHQFANHGVVLSDRLLDNKCADKRITTSSCNTGSESAATTAADLVRFSVHCLGWMPISEEDLTVERSSMTVNRCIIDLSLGRRSTVTDCVGRWGHGKSLYMDLDKSHLKIIDPESNTTLNCQPINTIRVWGVGRDNERDFAYVARDRITRKYLCHVFRCECLAAQISDALRDSCRAIMERRRHARTDSNRPLRHKSSSVSEFQQPQSGIVPGHRSVSASQSMHSLPQSLSHSCDDDAKCVISSRYMGCVEVKRARGMEVVRRALETIISRTPSAQWRQVVIQISSSTISVLDLQTNTVVMDIRVRFLSFFGIGRDQRHCGLIVEGADGTLHVHGFCCTCSGSAVPLCRALQAACQLRYQKCLDDTTPERLDLSARPHPPPSAPSFLHKSIMKSLRDAIGTLSVAYSNSKLSSPVSPPS